MADGEFVHRGQLQPGAHDDIRRPADSTENRQSSDTPANPTPSHSGDCLRQAGQP